MLAGSVFVICQQYRKFSPQWITWYFYFLELIDYMLFKKMLSFLVDLPQEKIHSIDKPQDLKLWLPAEVQTMDL